MLLNSCLCQLPAPGESPQLEWIEPPTQLGRVRLPWHWAKQMPNKTSLVQAPGEDGFDAWLADRVPKLQNEKVGYCLFCCWHLNNLINFQSICQILFQRDVCRKGKQFCESRLFFSMLQANGQVIFGVSTAGDIEHATGVLHAGLHSCCQLLRFSNRNL